jgi:hypothetical protein
VLGRRRGQLVHQKEEKPRALQFPTVPMMHPLRLDPSCSVRPSCTGRRHAEPASMGQFNATHVRRMPSGSQRRGR